MPRAPAAALLALVLLLVPSVVSASAAATVDVRVGPEGVALSVHVDELQDDKSPPAPPALEPPALPHPARKLLQRAHAFVHERAELVVLAEWTQPAVRGTSDLVAAVDLVGANGTWEGVDWVDAGDQSVAPRSLTIDAAGELLVLRANATSLTGRSIDATYHFLSLDGTLVRVDLPRIDVLDARPVEPRVAVGGAAAGRSWPGLPDALFVSVWNLFDDPRVVGFTLLDNSGAPIGDWTAGGCTAQTWTSRESEPGCRLLFTVPHDGATLVTWHERDDGSRIEHDRLDLADLRDAPHVFGRA